jgi:formyltetrahydrofolate deformylase
MTLNRQAYEPGVKIIGVSAHVVTMDLHKGSIIAHDSFAVRPNMSLKGIMAAVRSSRPGRLCAR